MWKGFILMMVEVRVVVLGPSLPHSPLGLLGNPLFFFFFLEILFLISNLHSPNKPLQYSKLVTNWRPMSQM